MAQFELPPLPYAYNALEPYIDEETMKLHHDKHHATYVEKLNAALQGVNGVEGKTIQQILRNIDMIPQEKRQAVINHGGGHANHTLFWEILSKDGAKQPSGALLEAINESFGSFEEFKTKFSDAAKTLFGSGWVWLDVANDGRLHIHATPNQNSPLMEGHKPILGLDVWEHAYYVKYRNKRPDYVDAFWNVVNWDKVNELYNESV